MNARSERPTDTEPLVIDHVESLHGIDTPLVMIRPSIFQRPSERRGAP
ncbi:hypothetical protein [Allochromatium tepidum]|uniref:Uncharacterized protein n=1 Tax=Allochromatium tepidum TaxID=553982 RepID=A0ABN6GAP7_9GAMM|nr:hypothetical protein [Allochromatium tepidum]BCU07000.1 hypothetical protein Atep_16770 [Allochromatium tepidum]